MRADEEHAIRAVASSFGGTWRPGEDPPDAYLMVGGVDVAVEISTLSQQVPGDQGGMIPRYSEDATALWIIEELKSVLRGAIPDGRRVLVGMESPVRRRGRVLRQLATQIQQLLIASRDVDTTIDILGNQIHVVIKGAAQPDPEKLHGFVMNQKSSPDIGLNAESLLCERISVKAIKCSALAAAGPVWLVLLNDYFLADPVTYQHSLARLRLTHPFERTLLVSGNGAVSQLFPG